LTIGRFDCLELKVTRFVGQVGGPNRQYASQGAGFGAVTIGAGAFMGWWTELPLLSSWGSGLPAMRPLGALLLAALGLALVSPSKHSRFAFAVGVAVATLAVLGLSLVGTAVLFNVEFGIIDRWLARWAVAPGRGVASLQIASAGTVAFGLVGGSLAFSRFERHRLTATLLAGLAGSIAVFALLGYLTGIDTLYGSVSLNSPPLPTAVGLLCIASGITFRIGTMPAPRKPRPLWQLLVLLGSAIVAPLLLFGAYAGFRTADAQLRQVRENLVIEARTLSASVDREIKGEIERLQALAASLSLREGNFAEFQRQAEVALGLPQSGNIVLIDRNMRQLVNTHVPFGEPLPKAVIPIPIAKALATDKPQVTDLFMVPIVNQLLIGIIVPVEINGETRYIVGRTPDQHALEHLVAGDELPTGWYSVVSDAAHHIISLPKHEGFSIGKELPLAQWHRTGADGVFEFIDSEGQPSLEASATSELTGWETAVWAPKALLEAPVRAHWQTLGATALLAFALVVGLALWLGRIIARSVEFAAQAAVASDNGGPLLPSPTPVAEVNAMMGELREITDLLRESEATFRAMFEVSSVGKVEVEPNSGRFLRVNAAMCRFVGYSEAELLARTVFDITHPEDRPRASEVLRCMVTGELAVFDMEKRYIRKDGNVVWGRVTANIIRDSSGQPLRDTAVVQDMTERKQREEQLQLLMREVNHRVKNMLSVVDAIAHQTAAKNPEDFVERFSDRIQALSANQDLLVRSDWIGVQIEDLVRAQLAPFADLIGSRIVVCGPRQRLNAASAQAIGLALHELATNAGKYGALSTDKGRVDISWGIAGDTFTMGWIERDGPRVSRPERHGFGTIVIKAMAERSLDGTVDLDYPPSGVTWRLTCPAANALSAGNDLTDSVPAEAAQELSGAQMTANA
jgi:PAS domain S-box-containing protein